MIGDRFDSISREFGRRDLLRGAAVIGVAAPLLWRRSAATASVVTPSQGPQWLGYGPDPTTSMRVSWSVGTAKGKTAAPRAPQIRWGLDPSYGAARGVDSLARAPIPSAVGNEPLENSFYNCALLSGLRPGTTYHYSVSNDGVTWGPDTIFTSASTGLTNFRFTAFGDQASSATSAAPMMALMSALGPAFHVSPGDLSYATPKGLKEPDVTGFHPAKWDKYLAMMGPGGAQSIPWQISVGAHEVEPLDNFGYAGFTTRFPQAYDLSSGSPVVFDFTYGNVAFLHLDGNDLSAQEVDNTAIPVGHRRHGRPTSLRPTARPEAASTSSWWCAAVAATRPMSPMVLTVASAMPGDRCSTCTTSMS